MDYFQGVVTEYLRADRAMFVNTECLIQIEQGDSPPKGTSWFCDAVAVNFREKTVYLCEVTYSASLQSLVGRLAGWNTHWPRICAALLKDCCLPADWQIRVWLFIPQHLHTVLDAKWSASGAMPKPDVTHLENVLPWKYRSWDRKVAALEHPENSSVKSEQASAVSEASL